MTAEPTMVPCWTASLYVPTVAALGTSPAGDVQPSARSHPSSANRPRARRRSSRVPRGLSSAAQRAES